jgi:hypothetical protein
MRRQETAAKRRARAVGRDCVRWRERLQAVGYWVRGGCRTGACSGGGFFACVKGASDDGCVRAAYASGDEVVASSCWVAWAKAHGRGGHQVICWFETDRQSTDQARPATVVPKMST